MTGGEEGKKRERKNIYETTEVIAANINGSHADPRLQKRKWQPHDECTLISCALPPPLSFPRRSLPASDAPQAFASIFKTSSLKSPKSSATSIKMSSSIMPAYPMTMTRLSMNLYGGISMLSGAGPKRIRPEVS